MGHSNEFCIDEVRACPLCGANLAERPSIVQEFWVAQDRHLDLWCSACQRHVTISFVARVTTQEPAGSPYDHP